MRVIWDPEFDDGPEMGTFGDFHVLPDGSVLIAYHFAQEIGRYDQNGNSLGVFADASEFLDRPNGIFYVVPSGGTGAPLLLGIAMATRRRR